MTLTITVAHKSGDDCAARIQQQGKPDAVIQPGESQEFVLWGCATTNLTISETSATKEVACEVGNAEQAAVTQETPADTALTTNEGEVNNG